MIYNIYKSTDLILKRKIFHIFYFLKKNKLFRPTFTLHVKIRKYVRVEDF